MLVSNELGGAGLVGLNLAGVLQTRLQESHIWIPGDGPAKRKAEELGLIHHVYDPANVLSSSRFSAAFGNWRIWQRFRYDKPGIVHIYSPLFYRAIRYAVKMSGLKSIVHIHLEEDKDGLSCDFKSPPDLIITCANFLVEHVRSALPRYLQKTQRIISVPNAVDVKRFSPSNKVLAKQKVGAPNGVPLVLMVANLAPHKGQETAILAAAILKEMKVRCHFWLAGIERGGKQEYTAHLYALCHRLKVADRVRFLGHREDVPELLRAADIFLLPSTAEGLPLSVLEAQATKVPVLAASTAGIPEVVTDRESGFLIPAEDALGYAHRIESLLRCPEISNRVTEQAYTRIIKQHNWSTYSEKVWTLYESLIEKE